MLKSVGHGIAATEEISAKVPALFSLEPFTSLILSLFVVQDCNAVGFLNIVRASQCPFLVSTAWRPPTGHPGAFSLALVIAEMPALLDAPPIGLVANRQPLSLLWLLEF
jgi:hypothetical protein